MNREKYLGVENSKVSNLLKRDFGTNSVRQRIEEATGKNGWIIGYLAEHKDEDVFQKDIETTFSIRRSTVSNMLGLMEKKGLIRRQSVRSDARLKKLTLTDKALDMYHELVMQLKVQEDIIKEGITEDELNVFYGVLEKIRNNIGTDRAVSADRNEVDEA